MADLVDTSGASVVGELDSANSLFEKEVDVSRQNNGVADEFREDDEQLQQEVGALDGFLLCERAAAELPEHVFHAKLSGLSITKFVEEDLSYFTSLTSIDLSDNRLPEMTPMQHFPVLRELNIACNALETLGRGLATAISNGDGFLALRFLDISYNSIGVDDIDALALLPKLEKLDISHNGLRSIHRDNTNRQDGHGEGETSTTDGGTRDEPSSSEARVFFPALRVLNAESNRLRGDCLRTLASLALLEDLQLAYNDIAKLPHLDNNSPEFRRTGVFPSLRRLDLCFNRITDASSLHVLTDAAQVSILLKGNACDTLLRTSRTTRGRTEKSHRRRAGDSDAYAPSMTTTTGGARRGKEYSSDDTSARRRNGYPAVAGTGDETALAAVNSNMNMSYKNSLAGGGGGPVSKVHRRKYHTRTFAPMPEDGWRQGLMPRDADGIGGVLGVVPHEELEMAFRRLEGEIQHRRTSELLSGIQSLQAAHGDESFIIEEGEEGEEEESDEYDSDDAEDEEDEEDEMLSFSPDPDEDCLDEDVRMDGVGIVGNDARAAALNDAERRKWTEIQSTQSAVNALRVFLSRSTMLEEPIIAPRYRLQTKSSNTKNRENQKRQIKGSHQQRPMVPKSLPPRAGVEEVARLDMKLSVRLQAVENALHQ